MSLPVFPEQGQQPGREHDVAILGPLGLTDADDHALAIDVVDAQGQDLGDPQSGGVGGHEEARWRRLVMAWKKRLTSSRLKTTGELGLAAGAGQAVEAPVLLECDAVEEFEGAEGLVVGAGGDVSVVGEVEQVGSDLGGPQDFG